MKEYVGNLNHYKLPDDLRSGYWSYFRQKKSDAGCQYTLRQFMYWWAENLKVFKGKTPTCGRIDHSKPYSFDNIIMQDMKDNSRESVLRNKNNIIPTINQGKKVFVHCKKTGNLIATIPTQRAAARLFDVDFRLIQNFIGGKVKTSKKINFILRGQ